MLFSLLLPLQLWSAHPVFFHYKLKLNFFPCPKAFAVQKRSLGDQIFHLCLQVSFHFIFLHFIGNLSAIASCIVCRGVSIPGFVDRVQHAFVCLQNSLGSYAETCIHFLMCLGN